MLPMFMQKPFDVQYFQHIKRLFGTALIGYWPLDEAAGASTVTDYSGQANNGTPSNVTFGQAGIGDGRTSALFVPASSSYVDVYSAGLSADFSGAEFTFAIWAKVSAAGVWTDGSVHGWCNFNVNANNTLFFGKHSVNNQVLAYTTSGGTSDVAEVNVTASTDWVHYALTKSQAADQIKLYRNNTQIGSTMTGIGAWSGTIGTAVIGTDTAVANYWSGNLAHAILLNQAATSQEIAEMIRISV